MSDDRITGEMDIEKMRVAALDLLHRNRALENENAVMLKEITRLTLELAKTTDKDKQLALGLELRRVNEMLAERNKELFGPSRSERRGRPEGDKPEEKPKPRQRGHGPNKQLKLPRVEVTHTREAAVQPCASCHEPQPPMAGQTEDTELVTIIERKVVLCIHKRQKYRCPTCGRIDTATGASKPIVPGGRYAPELAVAVATDKYAYHLPLERQVDRFMHQGFEVTSQTLWDLLVALYHWLLPVYAKLHAHLIAKPVLGADESPWRVMGKGRSAKWWTWALVGDDAVYYMLSPTRGKAAAAELLRGFTGVVSVDGYAAYSALEADYGTQASLLACLEDYVANNFTTVTCWAHARRGFVKAEANHPAAAGALDLIARLYAVEDKAESLAKDTGEPLVDVRRRLRDTESRPLVASLRTWLDAQDRIPGLQLDKAIVYANNQWPRLIRFLDQPLAPIDNTHSERAIRGSVLGRKNHYGSHSELGTRVAALFYTVVETCKLLDVDPATYMNEVMRRRQANPDDLLTPHAWRDQLRAREPGRS